MIETPGWMTAKDIAAFLHVHRTNAIKVRVNGVHVPILDLYYDTIADAYVIELVHGFGYQAATAPPNGGRRYGGGPQR